jgi:UDP-N-acetylglucosamine 2-epimerase (non-hydrolysing)
MRMGSVVGARPRCRVVTLARLDRPVLLLAHPRLRALAERYWIRLAVGSVRAHGKLPYAELAATVVHSRGVGTDSRRSPTESFPLLVPTIIRPTTECVETVPFRWRALANDVEVITKTASNPSPTPTDATPIGDRHDSDAVALDLLGRQR